MYTLKITNWKPYYNEVRRPAGGALMLYYLSSIADPTGRDGLASRYYFLSRRKKGFPPPLATAQPKEDSHS